MFIKVCYSVIGVAVLIFILLIVTDLNTPQQPVTQVQENQIVTNPLAVATSSDTVKSEQDTKVGIEHKTIVQASATPPTLDTHKAVLMLAVSTNYYSQLFSDAKKILGTKQYSNTAEGLSAFNDPSSSAVLFGNFRTETCLKNNPSANINNTYREVSNLYFGAKVNQTDALDNWNYNLNTTATDICEWAADAVSWQIREIATSKLKATEQKVDTDFATVKSDMSSISKL